MTFALATLGHPMTFRESMEWVAVGVMLAYLIVAAIVAWLGRGIRQ